MASAQGPGVGQSRTFKLKSAAVMNENCEVLSVLSENSQYLLVNSNKFPMELIGLDTTCLRKADKVFLLKCKAQQWMCGGMGSLCA